MFVDQARKIDLGGVFEYLLHWVNFRAPLVLKVY
jgi:hypothetical protein